MLPEIPEEQVRAAVEGIARQVLAEGDAFEPPVDASLLARRLGIVVAQDGAADTRARFVRLGGVGGGGQATILLADDPRPERRQWAVAHEIGESQAHRVFEELGVDPVEALPTAREAVANRLAGCLLLPRDWFIADGYAVDWDLFELKSRYAPVSHEMIARRMLEMPPPIIVTLFDHGKRQWRRSNRHSRTPPMTPPEHDAWKVAHERGEAARCEPAELPEGIEDVRAWPIHEPDWKREIVRTALADEW
jgi:Zn-dependent peptidase ImmA (M78 family)